MGDHFARPRRSSRGHTSSGSSHYVRVPRIVQRKISRRALFARDGWRCVYCGTTSGRLTLDHVVPRSKGGESVWENVVTSCAPCNLRKGNRLPHEVQMELPHPPRPPAPVLFIRLATPKIPKRWERYLAAYAGRDQRGGRLSRQSARDGLAVGAAEWDLRRLGRGARPAVAQMASVETGPARTPRRRAEGHEQPE